jgi:hypothetical protein
VLAMSGARSGSMPGEMAGLHEASCLVTACEARSAQPHRGKTFCSRDAYEKDVQQFLRRSYDSTGPLIGAVYLPDSTGVPRIYWKCARLLHTMKAELLLVQMSRMLQPDCRCL